MVHVHFSAVQNFWTWRPRLITCNFRVATPPFAGPRLVASPDRKRLACKLRGGARSRSEAFSIRRLGGSRWAFAADAARYGISTAAWIW